MKGSNGRNGATRSRQPRRMQMAKTTKEIKTLWKETLDDGGTYEHIFSYAGRKFKLVLRKCHDSWVWRACYWLGVMAADGTWAYAADRYDFAHEWKSTARDSDKMTDEERDSAEEYVMKYVKAVY